MLVNYNTGLLLNPANNTSTSLKSDLNSGMVLLSPILHVLIAIMNDIKLYRIIINNLTYH
jgi:hypothetical protein